MLVAPLFHLRCRLFWGELPMLLKYAIPFICIAGADAISFLIPCGNEGNKE